MEYSPHHSVKPHMNAKFAIMLGFIFLVNAALAETVSVPGKANPWLAGMTNGSTARRGDSAPDGLRSFMVAWNLNSDVGDSCEVQDYCPRQVFVRVGGEVAAGEQVRAVPGRRGVVALGLVGLGPVLTYALAAAAALATNLLALAVLVRGGRATLAG